MKYQQILLHELGERRRHNPSYSLRAFARDLGVAGPTLSDILKNKKGLSRKSAEHVATRLRLSPIEHQIFVHSVLAQHARSSRMRQFAMDQLKKLETETFYNQMDLEKFQLISDWYYFAILELCDTSPHVCRVDEIAQRLQLDNKTVGRAVERLQTLGLLDTAISGWKQTHKDLVTPTDIPSVFLRQNHLQVMKKAEESLLRDPVADRDFSNITMAIPSDQIDFAKAEIKKFRRRLARKLNQGRTSKDRVYNLSIQFFPLDRKSAKRNGDET